MRARRLLLAAGFLGMAGIVHNQERPQWIRHVIPEGFRKRLVKVLPSASLHVGIAV